MYFPRFVLAALIGAAIFVPGPAVAQNGRSLGHSAAQNGRALALSAEAVLLLDPDGRVLYAKNSDDDHAPASLVKLMTLYLAYADLEDGRVALDDLATVSRNAATTPRYRMGLRTGEQVAVRTLMEGVAIASANDAATALAEYLAADEAAFVERMNAKAQEFGLTSTRFANPHGLPDPRQRTCARDIAELTSRLLLDHPGSRTMLGGQTFLYNRRLYARHIPLFQDPGGVQALKTGFTNEAGYNLSVAAWRDGQQFLMVVLGARSRALSFADAKKLLRFAFTETGLEVQEPPTVKREAPKRRTRARRAVERQ
ncbi:MAG: D-alanyl-D-alanine carboxypeptidase [Candidatus Rokubacteria bacterium]|nr:D-alanyl-D-alanine carboxypeptidase [Candidatus Rokubacteria bacterium]